MMKGLIALIMLASLATYAETIVFSSTGSSTGDELEGVDNTFTTVSVIEIPGLTMTAKTDTAGHTLNANAGDFGINSTITGEMSDAFDFGEKMIFKFDEDVVITGFDFGRFTDGDQFNVIIESTNTINYSDLDNKTSQYLDGLSWQVNSGTEVSFATTSAGNGQIDLETMDVSVIPEPTALSFLLLAGAALLRRRH